jgi:hypothetical protein
MKWFTFTAILLAAIFGLSAQSSLDIFTLEGRYGIPRAYDSLLDNKANETGIMSGLTAPVPFSEKTILYNNITYFHWNVTNGETLPAELANPINLHGFILRTGLYQKFSRGRGIQVFFSPRLMSDLQYIGNNSFQLGGLVMYEKEYSDDLKLSYGLLYNQEQFGPYLVPLLNINWNISSYWSISGLMPIYAKIKYQKNENFSAGFSHFGLLTTYHLGKNEYRDDYIERMSIDLSLFARQKIVNNFYIEGRIGHTFSRRYTQYDGNDKVDFAIPLVFFGDNRVAKNVEFKNGIIASLRIVYNIPIPSSN